MGNCCSFITKLLSKTENRPQNDSLLENNLDHGETADLTIPPHVGEGGRKRLSFSFGSPLSLSSDETKSFPKTKQDVKSEISGESSTHGQKSLKKQESEEEGYGSSFEAVHSTSKDMASKQETENKAKFLDGAKRYEIEIETALASIKDTGNSEEKKNKDSVEDYYSI